MASVNVVQRNTTTLSAGQASVTATITSIDPAKSFLMFTVRLSTNQPDFALVSGKITNATTLTFERVTATGSPAVVIHWQVVSFTSGVTVYRGTATHTGNTVTNVPLNPAVSLGWAFPIISWRSAGVTIDENDFISARIDSTTNLRLESFVAGAAGGCTVEWQVVEFTDDSLLVKTGTAAIGSLSLSATATVSPPISNLNNTLLLYTHRVEGGTASRMAPKLITGRITNTTTLTFERYIDQNFPITVRWYLLEFSDGTTVRRSTVALPAGTTVVNTTLDPAVADTAKTLTLAGGGSGVFIGKQRFDTDDNPGYGAATADLTSASNLRLTRTPS